MIPIQLYLKDNPININKLLPSSKFTHEHEKIILDKFSILNANCKPNELIGISYNYVAHTINTKSKISKDKAIQILCRILNLNYVDIIKGKTCAYIRKR